jgi:hypothetical protein
MFFFTFHNTFIAPLIFKTHKFYKFKRQLQNSTIHYHDSTSSPISWHLVANTPSSTFLDSIRGTMSWCSSRWPSILFFPQYVNICCAFDLKLFDFKLSFAVWDLFVCLIDEYYSVICAVFRSPILSHAGTGISIYIRFFFHRYDLQRLCSIFVCLHWIE